MSTTPHDALFKAVFGQPEHARGILRSIVPATVGEAIDWRALTLCPGSFVDAALAHQHSDLLYSSRWRGGNEALLYFLFEHQSTPPASELMAFRLLRYQVRIWERWWAEHPKAPRLPAIVPIVLYHGEARWSEARTFEELLELPAELRAELEPYLVRCRYLLHDLSDFSEDELRENVWATALAKLAAVLFRQGRLAADPTPLLRRWMSALREVAAAANGLDALAQLLRYILEVNEHATAEQLQLVLERGLGPKAQETFMTLAQQLREQGLAQGREQGLAQGREQGLAQGREQGLAQGREQGLAQGREQGLAQGREQREQASRALLLRLVQQRFGAALEPHHEQRLHSATLEQVEAWLLRILTAGSPAELLAD